MDKIKALQYLMSISENKQSFDDIYDEIVSCNCPEQWGLPKLNECEMFNETSDEDCEECWKAAFIEAILG